MHAYMYIYVFIYKNNQNSCMINENQRCKMVYFIKIIEKYLCNNILDSHSRIHLQV